MKYAEFSKKSQLPENKRRTLNELANFVAVRTDSNPNYTLLLGAGCSISSGVRSGAELARIWRDEICRSAMKSGEYSDDPVEQITFLKSNFSSWYDPTREYSSLFERKFDLQRQRRMFVEHEVSNKKPSIGYAYLTSLIDAGYFGTVFTTNFDDLLNESFYLYSNDRPIVCAHDSSINSITVTSRRPKIIKLHGDYLFDDIKSTARETESLEQNMKEKFIEFSKDYGLVVVGYAGGDRSIMDLLALLLKNEDYFKGGIYWCIRSDSDVSEELKKLIWKDRVFFVEIDGFDELFAEVFSKVNGGDVLPLTSLSITRRPNDIINSLLSSPSMFPETTDTLRSAKQKLVRQSKNFRFAESIIDQSGEKKDRFSSNGLTEDELISITSLQKLISNEDFEEAIKKGRWEIDQSNKISFRAKVLRLIIQCYRSKGDSSSAVNTCDELIRLQPNNASNYLLRAVCVEDSQKKLEYIKKAIDVDPFSVSARIDLANYFIRLANDCHGGELEEFRKQAVSELKISLEMNPSRYNGAWEILFDLYVAMAGADKSKDKCVKGLIERLNEQTPYGYVVLGLRCKLISRKSDKNEISSLINDIEYAAERTNDDDNYAFYELRLEVFESAGMIQELENEMPLAEENAKKSLDVDLAMRVASVFRKIFGNDFKAIEILEYALESYEFNANVFNELVRTYVDLKKFELANQCIDRYRNKVSTQFLSEILENYYIEKGEYELAISEHSRRAKILGTKGIGELSYIYLKSGQNELAEKATREYLESCNFSTKAISELINYEIAKCRNGKKVDIHRLDLLLGSTDDYDVKAAIFAIKGKIEDMVEAIREAIKIDMTFRFRCNSWPVFDSVRSEKSFMHEVGRTVRLSER